MNKKITYVSNTDPKWMIEAVSWSGIQNSTAEVIPAWVVDLLVGQHDSGSRIQFNGVLDDYFLCHVYKPDELLNDESYVCFSKEGGVHVRNYRELDMHYHFYVEGVDIDV